jgi:hypothetical protein
MIVDKRCIKCGREYQCNGIGRSIDKCSSIKYGCYCIDCFLKSTGFSSKDSMKTLTSCAKGIEKEELDVLIHIL